MPMLTGRVDFVIGVDTHKQSHTAALVDALGAVLAMRRVSTDLGGYRELLEWARAVAAGRRAWAVEGTGSYGAGLTAHLLEQDEWVCEADRPKRPIHKGGPNPMSWTLCGQPGKRSVASIWPNLAGVQSGRRSGC